MASASRPRRPSSPISIRASRRWWCPPRCPIRPSTSSWASTIICTTRPAPHRHGSLLHHQLPGAGGQGHPRELRHPPRQHHHHARHHQYPERRRSRITRTCAAPVPAAALIPTSTGSATAITEIFPELTGRLNGIAVPRAHHQCLADRLRLRGGARGDGGAGQCRAEGAPPTASSGHTGLRERPLVSVDYVNDPRSSIIDALSTMVINGTQVKIYAWYDNEWGM
jgi:hypothetical protein